MKWVLVCSLRPEEYLHGIVTYQLNVKFKSDEFVLVEFVSDRYYIESHISCNCYKVVIDKKKYTNNVSNNTI